MAAAVGVGVAGGVCHCSHGSLDRCDDVSNQTSSLFQATALLHFHSFTTANYTGTC